MKSGAKRKYDYKYKKISQLINKIMKHSPVKQRNPE